ncbi:MAG: hypothetical protein ACRDOI_06240 [Trebonia sp.]
MFLSGVLFVVFLTCILGAIAWAITRKWHHSRPAAPLVMPSAAADALARHPASRARRAGERGRTPPIGPDDDPEFLRQLAERIRGER